MSEKVVGWGISHHLQNKTEPVLRNNKLVIEAERFVFPLIRLSSMNSGIIRNNHLSSN